MDPVRSAADLIAKYDRPSRPWTKLFQEVPPDGLISAKETGLDLREKRVSDFVEDLGGLPDDEFALAIGKMSDDAIANFLYNRYYRLFSKWDNGRMFNGVVVSACVRDANIDDAEINIAGGMDALVADFAETLDARDFDAACSIDLISGRAAAAEFQTALLKLKSSSS